MTTSFQICIDSADPHALARFWAAATGYEIEDNDAQIRRLLEAGVATAGDVVETNGRLAWKTATAANDPDGRLPRLLFQQVPEPKTVKNRWHLDLHVGPDRRDDEIARLTGLGATHLWDGQEGPSVWATMSDPEGNEFCVA